MEDFDFSNPVNIEFKTKPKKKSFGNVTLNTGTQTTLPPVIKNYINLVEWKRLFKEWYEREISEINLEILKLIPHISPMLTENKEIPIDDSLGPPGKIKITHHIKREIITQKRLARDLKQILGPYFLGIKNDEEVEELMLETSEAIWKNRPIVKDEMLVERVYSNAKRKA